MSDSLKKYYDILELDSTASGDDIIQAYKYLKNLYSKTSLATAPVDDEWNEDDKKEILNQLEEAYVKLWPYAREERMDELDEGPTLTPLEDVQPKIAPLSNLNEYKPQEEPAVSIELDEVEPVQPAPVPTENKAELFDSYVEEEVLFDLGPDPEIDTEIDIEIEKVDENKPLKEEMPKEEVSQKDFGNEVPQGPEKEMKNSIDKEDTLAEHFIEINAQPVTGTVLKQIREKMELDFPGLANSIQVPVDVLEAIEAEAFGQLPEAGYLRYYVTNYARALGFPDPKNAADQYMKRFREWKSGPGPQVIS